MANRSFGPFELEGQLGAGSMGVVHRAKYTRTGRYVALKLLPQGADEDETLLARFTREIEILKRLWHPNIVQCYGGGELDGQRFCVMELVSGGSLSQILKDRGKIGWKLVIEYGLQICDALDHAHQKGIVHRDLKPANLMLDQSGRIKLTDFGLARLCNAKPLTAAGRTVGTYAYMAPEQITGESPISPKTDLYAFGVVLFELLTGRTPFVAKEVPDMFMRHLNRKPPFIRPKVPDCPIWLERLVLMLLEKDPANRPPDALTVGEALSEIIETVGQRTNVA